MTLHAAKGLEFPVVFMVGMEDGLFPSAQSELEPARMEEERRLCYVGMTRAREELYLTYADRRMVRGDTRFNIPSVFLADAMGDEALCQESSSDGIDEEISYDNFDDYSNSNYGARANHRSMTRRYSNEPHYEPEQVNLSLGDKVRHNLFGVGVVTSIDGSIVEVHFKKDGVSRKLNVAFAPLTKIN